MRVGNKIYASDDDMRGACLLAFSSLILSVGIDLVRWNLWPGVIWWG